jgi:peroxiredoxin
MIVVYRGKHCPVSKNYLASLQQIYYELDELGVEVIAVSGDGRERAEAFVSSQRPHCAHLYGIARPKRSISQGMEGISMT